VETEFQKLMSLGWNLPPVNSAGHFAPVKIDESKISFPAEKFDSEAINNEASGFWALQRAELIARMLQTQGVSIIWEIGAGNGNVAIPLRNLGLNVLPVEPLQTGAITLHKNGFATFCSTLEDLKLPENSIATIGAFDVLEHLENPQTFLSEVFRVLEPGGLFICSVPAYQWLFSDFDVSIGHYRRYTKKMIEGSLLSSGLEMVSTRYLFGFLVPVAFVLRRIVPFFKKGGAKLRNSKPGGSESKLFNKLALIFKFFVLVEQKLRLPLGLSLFSMAQKPLK
jgi:2-polyprenyl-3-methyl-5-hydroxy-6-metoxy-1,4-benzoquinol methylase